MLVWLYWLHKKFVLQIHFGTWKWSTVHELKGLQGFNFFFFFMITDFFFTSQKRFWIRGQRLIRSLCIHSCSIAHEPQSNHLSHSEQTAPKWQGEMLDEDSVSYWSSYTCFNLFFSFIRAFMWPPFSFPIFNPLSLSLMSGTESKAAAPFSFALSISPGIVCRHREGPAGYYYLLMRTQLRRLVSESVWNSNGLKPNNIRQR